MSGIEEVSALSQLFSNKVVKSKYRKYQLLSLVALLTNSEIPHDDRLLIRKQLKQAEPEILEVMESYKKERSLGELQVRLRKYVSRAKGKGRVDYARRVYSQQSQGNSYHNSHHATPEKD